MQKFWVCLLTAIVATPTLLGQSNNRILVVSGGGARGAWGAGFAKRLTDSFYGVYNVAFGTSTGSLMIPLIVLNEFSRLEKAYTNVTQQNIFTVNPFTKDGNLRPVNAAIRVLHRKKTLGESQRLRQLIEQFVPDSLYHKLQREKKVLGFAVVDFRTGDVSLQLSSSMQRPAEMKDWLWASSNQPLFMTYFPDKGRKANDGYYVDGGVRETVPLQAALHYATQNDIRNIDVIINQPKVAFFDRAFKPASIFDGLMRLIEIWRQEVVDNDVLLATEATDSMRLKGDTIHINLHYFPTDRFYDNRNDLLFDSTKMRELWSAGYQGEEDSGELLSKPGQIVVGRSAVARFFSLKNDYRLKLQEVYERQAATRKRKSPRS